MTEEMRIAGERLRQLLIRAGCCNAATIITAVGSMIADGRGDAALESLAQIAVRQAGFSQDQVIQRRRPE